MDIATPRRSRFASPFDMFWARCEARAWLYAAGELNLQEAVDSLQAAAIANGLVAAIGQDSVQLILSEEFGKVRRNV